MAINNFTLTSSREAWKFPPTPDDVIFKPKTASKSQDLLRPRYLITAAKDDKSQLDTMDTPLRTRSRACCLVWIITRYSWIYFGLALLFHLAVLATTVILYLSGYPIFLTNFDTLPLDVRNSDILREQVAWQYRFDTDTLYDRRDEILKTSAERMTLYEKESISFIYKNKDNILKKEHLKSIQYLEDQFYYDIDYQMKYCYLEKTKICQKPRSILRLFDGTFAQVHPIFNDTNFNNIKDVLSVTKQIPQLTPYLDLLGKNFHFDNASLTFFADTILTTHSVGLPLAGFNSTNDADKKQRDIIRNYLVTEWLDVWKNYTSNNFAKLEILFHSQALFFYELNENILHDCYYMIGSILFIFVFAWIQTGSFWLSIWGLFNTVCSFISGNLIYNCLWDFKWIGGFHLVSVFIILGIAADNIFIFCDTWKLLANQQKPDLTVILSQCYSKAAKSMLVTSVTTAAAFLLNCFSPILAMSAFGAYSGVVILINYVYVIMFYPVVIVIWQKKFAAFRYCCGKNKNKIDDIIDAFDCRIKTTITQHIQSNNETLAVTQKTTQDLETSFWSPETSGKVVEILHTKQETNFSATSPEDSTEEPKERVVSSSSKTKERRELYISNRKIVRFFSGPYYRFMSKRIVQAVVIVCFVLLTFVMIYFVTKLKSDDKKPRAMKASNSMEKFLDTLTESFEESVSNPYGKLYIVWGMRKQNMTACHTKKHDYCFGKTDWDPNFDLNPAPAQMHLLEFCKKLRNLSLEERKKLKIKSDKHTGKPIVQCFMDDMDQFYRTESLLQDKHQDTIELSVPMSPRKTRQMMTSHHNLYNVSILDELFYRYFETAYAYWITERHSSAQSYRDLVRYSYLIGETKQSADVTSLLNKHVGQYGTRLTFSAIEIQLEGVNPHNTYYKDGLKVYDHWQNFVKTSVDEMAAPLRGAFQTTTFEWHWFHMQSVLTNQAILSVILGVCVAWIVLIVSSGNWIVGTMATITIASICLCVIGVIPIIGWKYGLLEAINTTLVVGLAVDYVVHLGIAYNKAPHTERGPKVQHALREYATSVLSGAATTIGSTFFMFFTKVVFFSVFAAFMFTTIGFSIIFALTFFIVMLLFIGPQGDTGSNRLIIQYIMTKCCSSYMPSKCAKCDRQTMQPCKADTEDATVFMQ